MKKYLPLLLIAMMAYSCKKDGINPAEKQLISSETITDYYPADSTFNFVVNMQYDDNNRLTATTRNYGPRYYINTSNYSYDSNGNIVQLSFLVGSNPDGAYTYSYKNGVPLSTSYQASNSTSVVVEAIYTTQGSKVTGVTFPNSSDLTETLTYNGNNYNVLSYSNGTTYTYTYGDHKSPFLYTGLKYSLYGLEYTINDNEILEIKAVNSTGGVTDQKNVFTYNAEGYPLKEQTYTNGTLTETVIFSYTEVKQ
jgi:hypothetical protein